MPATPQATEQLSQVLNELTDFQDYFTEDEKINELVDYIHDQTNVNKAAIRLSIKRIAPFLASSVGRPMLRKLHGKLSQYDWYFTLSQRLLDSLKTLNDRTVDLALDIPSLDNLESLITDKAKWANLNAEHQGFVQLLLGQHSLSEGLDGTRQAVEAVMQQQLETLVNKLSLNLDLKAPDFLKEQAQRGESGSAQWLTYGRQQARLIGRESSLLQLNNFIEHEDGFRWWAITGKGGIGKSRLALDVIQQHNSLWEVGFLSHTKLKKDDALSNWKTQSPTIIVVDYAAECPDAISNWIDYFIKHEGDFDFPVRLLILEREYKEQKWWNELTSINSAALIRRSYLHLSEPHELLELDSNQQRAVLESFLESLDCFDELPDEDAKLWGSLDSLSDKGRPLFIGMVAVAIANHGIHKLRDWNQEDLLSDVLRHEQAAWDRQLTALTQKQKGTVYQLLAFSTVISGFDEELNARGEHALYKILSDCGFGEDNDEIEANIALVNQLSNGKSGALQPDIFAEYFVIQQWNQSNGSPQLSLRKRLLAAQKLNTESTHAFISRAAVDYPKNKQPFSWWSILHDATKIKDLKSFLNFLPRILFGPLIEDPTKTNLNIVSLNIVSQLSLHGYYTEALKYWLPPVAKSREPRIRARALNELGLKNHMLGNYSEALKQLEGSLGISKRCFDKPSVAGALNNISNIYDARGDYETAISYLNQSLKIIRKIGDKRGEGSALNNIASIYRERGDDKTAMTYLEQALKIQQEIDDKSGEASALHNIAQIYSTHGDEEMAMKYLDQSLNIQREIGNKHGESAALHNIASIYSTYGDDETAMKYYMQSLTIKQEIGDIAGECVTKFNIGYLQHKTEQYDEAMKNWAEAYEVTKRINLAEGLKAFEALAEQLEALGGLEGLEAVLTDLYKKPSEDA